MGSCLACALAVSGCAEGYVYDAHGTEGGHLAFGGFQMVGDSVVPVLYWVADPPAEEEPRAVPCSSRRRPAHAEPLSKVAPGDAVHRPFDATAALAALHAVDLSPCAERAARGTYGHARVTFSSDGAVAGVHIDDPTGGAEETAACVEQRLGRIAIAPFDGGAMTVGASYFVR